MKHLLVALIVSLSTPASASETDSNGPTVFQEGSAQAVLPSDMEVTSVSSGLRAVFGSSKDHTLELSFSRSPPGTSADGREFVRAAAVAKAAQLKTATDRVLFMDPAGDLEREGKTFRIVHWQIGVQEGVFVLTVTAPMPMSPELDDFLGAGLQTMVNSVAAVDPD
ncbi:hypothetical protein [Arenimonas terrae]|uniref:DUF1795 domain-containing protein n=1 Tax=Arenimonas terrae TaxID=2546226 RepID=A0A5C4RNZ4_9GAMM|nr:hypothetical protein [Arenimonas terrae]TNJ32973.1 hypothetical protein E1B00_11695 [Arenimonas terrae]